MKKRILSLVLALSMMISLFPVSAPAQTPGGGTAEMAEERDTNGYITTLEMNADGTPVTDGRNTDNDGNYIGTNWKYNADGEGLLTLTGGTWDFTKQNAVKCYVAIDEKATVAGGTFENTVWNQADGKISGGTFKKTVSNKGTITGGIFVGVDSESTSVISYDTGKITGGVFKVLPSNGIDSAANQYRIEFADTANTDTLSVNDVDFGTGKVYVVGMDNEELTIAANSTDLTNVNQTRNSATSSKTITFKPGSVKQESEKDDDTYLLKLNAELYEAPLVMMSNGVPDTSKMTPDAAGVYHGNNWTYGPGGRYGRLTLTSGEWDFSNTKPADGTGSALSVVNCIVQINDGATVKGGTFNIVVNTGNREQNIKGGIIAGGTFNSSVNNCGGTIKDGKFTHCVNDNLGDAKGIIEGGTFARNGNSDSVTNRGIISGGIFNGLVTSYWSGSIKNGTFNGKVSNYGSIDGGYFLSADDTYDTASKVSGGVFETIPSKVESTSNLYKIQFDSESGAETTNTLSVDNHDFGMTSVYVVGADDTELTVTAKDKILTSVNNKANTTASSNSITFKLGEVKLADEKDGNAYLLKLNAKLCNSELEIGEDGKPNTSNAASREEDNKTIWYGTGWTYDGTTLTLSGSSWSFSKYPAVTCSVALSRGTALYGGVFKNTVSGSGYITGGIFLNRVTVSAENINTGIFKTAPNGTTCYTVKAGDSSKLGVKVNGAEFVDFGTDEAQVVNRIGNFVFSVQLRDANGDVVKIANINGKEIGFDAYGSHTVDNSTAVRFTMPSENVVLNQEPTTKTYTLTLIGATAEPAREQYTEGQIIKLTAEDAAEGKEFDKWELDGLTLKNGYQETNATIEVTINGNATAKATYKDKAPTTYTLTVEDGYIGTDKNQISGNYEAGATIKLTAEDAAEGEQFEKWELTGLTLKNGYQETNATIEVTITGNATAKATYKDKAPTTYTLTVDGGYIGDDETKASGEFKAEAQIKVTAKAKTGYHFTKWTVEGGTLSLSEEKLKANPLTFEMPDGAVSLKANYGEDTPDPVDPNPTPNPDAQPKTYTVTVKGGKINNETEVKAEKGTKLTVDVDESEVPEGMTFDVWSISFPKGVEDTLTGDPSVMLHDPHMSFTMPEADITIEAQYRSSELPGEDDGPSALGTMATVAVGGAAAGILVWQGVSLGVDSYLQLNLPKGVAVPANRRELVVLLWETAGKPEAALPSLYSDVPAEEIELQKATRWAIDNGLVKPADDNDASRFDPDRYVTKYDVFGAWLKLKKLMK